MIDPEHIRRRLAEVWTSLGDEVMRACALTLITVVDSDNKADSPVAIAQTLAELMPEHPSRSIVVRLESEDCLEADVEAQCWMPFGQRRQICSEQIVIRCSGNTLDQVPGVVLPLIVPDLPVVVWCASREAFRSPAFPALAASAHRVLIDSFRIPEAFPAPGIADLSWTRLTRWRALLAQVFENKLYRGDFSTLTVYHESSRPPAALLFAGWLNSRLTLHHIDFHSNGLEPTGRISGIELASDSTRIAIHRLSDSSGEVRLELAGRDPVMNRVSLTPSTDLLLVGEELSIHSRDLVYEQSREEALRIGEGSL